MKQESGEDLVSDRIREEMDSSYDARDERFGESKRGEDRSRG